MLLLNVSMKNVYDANGIWISITGMTIVFAALILITIILSMMPRILPILEKIYPESEGHHHSTPSASNGSNGDEESLVAAIGFALHAHSNNT